LGGILEQEEQLFAKWRQHLPQNLRESFVSDGAVNADAFTRSAPKILLLLKEVNDLGGGGWCLRELLTQGERKETWDVVTRWVFAMRQSREVDWSELEHINHERRIAELSTIAAMNLKKIPGGHTTDAGSWWQAVMRDSEYIKRQYDIYKADLTICCGSIVTGAFNEHMKPSDAGPWKRTSRGIEYLQLEGNRIVIAYSHPQARIASNLIHYGLIDAVQEIWRS